VCDSFFDNRFAFHKEIFFYNLCLHFLIPVNTVGARLRFNLRWPRSGGRSIDDGWPRAGAGFDAAAHGE
jgi:hypothetical protein